MKSKKRTLKLKFNFGHLMYAVTAITIAGLLWANIAAGSQKENVRVLCESGGFFDEIKDDYPELNVVARNAVPEPSPQKQTSAVQGAVVNINTATLEELCTLSGIGETRAEAIIQYRTENGSFKSIEEICRVKGIGEATFDKIRGSITV
ncbi:MAG: ComEA family DNA-binding protein [Oscillospiraceae bacterium]